MLCISYFIHRILEIIFKASKSAPSLYADLQLMQYAYILRYITICVFGREELDT